MSELRERFEKRINEHLRFNTEPSPLGYARGAMSVYPILEGLVAYVEKDAKAYAQTKYDSGLHLGGQSLAEDIMDKLNAWLDGSE